MKFSSALRTVALFEGAKGMLALLAGFGLLSLVHEDAQRLVEQVVAHFHLNPAARYPRIFVEAATQLTDTRLALIACGALAYAVVRFIEAYGLWYARRWAQWFAAASGAIYIPFEVFELTRRVDALSLAALVLNIAVVAIMLHGVLHPGRDGPREVR